MKVQKDVTADERTLTSLRDLSKDDRVVEVARMLAGDTDSQASREHAEELLEKFSSL
jgi:DNA repair ATPase RecN